MALDTVLAKGLTRFNEDQKSFAQLPMHKNTYTVLQNQMQKNRLSAAERTTVNKMKIEIIYINML